jgi:hypothetical protein
MPLIPYEPGKGMENQQPMPDGQVFIPLGTPNTATNLEGDAHATQPNGGSAPGNPTDQAPDKGRDDSCTGS